MTFEAELSEALDGAEKAVIVGVGNDLNGDDGFGVFVTGKLGDFGRAISISARTVPENFISKIASMKPSHVIFIDAAMLNAEPGTMQLLKPEDLARIKIMTHHFPLSKLIERLTSLHECRIFIIGFEPNGMEVGDGLSAKARKSAKSLIVSLRKNLS